MTNPMGTRCQAVHSPSHAQPIENPAHLAGRLLRQFEADLSKGDNERARLVNTALMELQKLMEPQLALSVNREIELAWRRATGWSF